MPEKPLTIATYAAGASLAAITLVYVFAPTFFIDGDQHGNPSARKPLAVGLSNPANDCFINSILQVLAGLGDLRLYLIRETHRRKMDQPEVYKNVMSDPGRPPMPAWELGGLQQGLVTSGLKDILDRLNERPIYKKTISADYFIQTLEKAFKKKVSRQQQDAQEFLQVIVERLSDEYHAGHRARRRARTLHGAPVDASAVEQQLDRVATNLADLEVAGGKKSMDDSGDNPNAEHVEHEIIIPQTDIIRREDDETIGNEEGFPLEGAYESQIECRTCGFQPRSSKSIFNTLMLHIEQVGSTSLNKCLDTMFKTETIDDFKCEKCRLLHAIDSYRMELSKARSEKSREFAEEAISKLQKAVDTDPENPPVDVALPDSSLAPQRKINRHVRLTKFPKVLAIHLNRSVFELSLSSKNATKVTYPEILPMGSILDQKKYKLLGVVSHKGGHNSGHYESFRRQVIQPPYSTHNTFEQSPAFTPSVPCTPADATPIVSAALEAEQESSAATETPDAQETSPASASPVDDTSLPSAQPSHPRTSVESQAVKHAPTSAARKDRDSMSSGSGSSLRSVASRARDKLRRAPSSISLSKARRRQPSSKSLHPSSSPVATNVTGSTVDSTATGSTNTAAVQSGTSTVTSAKGHSKEKKELKSRPSVSFAAGDRKFKRRKKHNDRWWRISDDKVKECKTNEVLGMQKEVYLLFYELVRDGENV